MVQPPGFAYWLSAIRAAPFAVAFAHLCGLRGRVVANDSVEEIVARTAIVDEKCSAERASARSQEALPILI
jgi:hypothetical protein